jgi:hypothetical protein
MSMQGRLRSCVSMVSFRHSTPLQRTRCDQNDALALKAKLICFVNQLIASEWKSIAHG